MTEHTTAMMPRLACADSLAAAVGRVSTTDVTDVITRLIGDRATFRVEDAGGSPVVLIAFAPKPKTVFDEVKPLGRHEFAEITPVYLRGWIVDVGLPEVLGVEPGRIDFVTVADELRRRALARWRTLEAAGQVAEQAAIVRRAEDADKAEQRAALLRQLAELDGQMPAKPATGLEQRKRWPWS